MQNFWYLLVSLKNLQKEINDQVEFLENFKDNFEKIDTERSIKSVEETLKTYLKVIKRLKEFKMTQEDKEYLKDLIYSQKEVFRNGTDEEVDKISDEIMEKIIDVSFKYAKAEQDEIFEYCYEIMYQIDKELINEVQ